MIDIIGSAITDEIVRRLKDAEIFVVMADETPDASHKEQLSVFVRYVYQAEIEERVYLLFESWITLQVKP